MNLLLIHPKVSGKRGDGEKFVQLNTVTLFVND